MTRLQETANDAGELEAGDDDDDDQLLAGFDTTLEETAYHEAGHFVIGHTLGLARRVVSIEPGVIPGTLGYVHGEVYPTTVRDGELVGDVEAGIVTMYAGGAAAECFGPGEDRRAGCDSDDEQADRLLQLLAGSDTDQRAMEQELRQRADLLVAKHGPEIEALAYELLHARTISATAAELIIAMTTGEGSQADVDRYRQWPGLDR